MKRYEFIVVSCTLLFLTVWFFTNNFGGVYFSASPRLSLEGVRGKGIVVTGREKEEALREIKKLVERRAQ